eukprot:scaffold876_cov243-Pinguiococcus_pyrenoidosus.AAC.55
MADARGASEPQVSADSDDDFGAFEDAPMPSEPANASGLDLHGALSPVKDSAAAELDSAAEVPLERGAAVAAEEDEFGDFEDAAVVEVPKEAQSAEDEVNGDYGGFNEAPAVGGTSQTSQTSQVEGEGIAELSKSPWTEEGAVGNGGVLEESAQRQADLAANANANADVDVDAGGSTDFQSSGRVQESGRLELDDPQDQQDQANGSVGSESGVVGHLGTDDANA